MLCHRCGSHNPDSQQVCSTCGQKLAPGPAQGAASGRKRPYEGAPYKTGDIVALRFRVKDVAGQGPLGFLFKVEDVAAGGDLALKSINPNHFRSPEERDNFQRAIRLGRKLSHPNLVRVVEDGEDRGWPFYATQFVDGLSLRRILDVRKAKGQQFSLAEIEPLVTQIGIALAAAHKIGTHGDLKPENVLVQPDLLKVTDFGLAAAMPRDAFLASQRTRAYLAPEVVAGGPLEPRTDVFALGVLIGELFTGQLPQDRAPLELARLRPELPPGIDALYRKALSSSPSARFASVSELAGELSAVIARASLPRAAPRSPVTSQVGSGAIAYEPPPVADEHLARPPSQRRVEPAPASTVPIDLSMLPAALKAGGDETQQMDAGLIAQAIAAKTAASESLRAPEPPRAPRMASPPSVVVRPDATQPIKGPPPGPMATQPLDSAFMQLLRNSQDNSPTMALPAFPQELLDRPPLFGNVGGGAPTSSTPRSNATIWLAVLTAAGLITGTLGGYLLLQRLRRRPEPPPVAQTTPPPPAATATTTTPPPANTPPPQATPPETATPTTAAAAVTAPATNDVLTCPDGMRLVPAGAFMMGTAKDDPMMGFDEKALARVEVGAFCIDEYEYPNKYKVGPRTKVTWAEAKKACEADQKRLCAEPEWEKACKGPDNRRFPYGNGFDAAACNTETETGEDRSLSYAGGFDRCRSGYGISDLSGNAAEWTATAYGSGQDKAVKGGAYDRPDYAARCSARRNGSPNARAAEIGFRCCADPGKL